MHPAPIFEETDLVRLEARIEAMPFMTVFGSLEARPVVAHAPVILRRFDSGLALEFHLSRNNPLARELARGETLHLIATTVLAEAYISPDWYETADQVPTWNYVSIEVEGPVTAMSPEQLVTQLHDLSATHEALLAPKPPWTRHKMSPGRFEAMLGGIVGARMDVARLAGTTKLSQNKSDEDRLGVISALGEDPMAAWMKRLF
jgi:transcriptional regulator